MKRINFIAVCTGWKCEDFQQRCLDSIIGQKNVFVRVSKRVDGKDRRGKLYNFIMAVNDAKPLPDDVICDVDLDDHLLPGALSVVEREYLKNPKLLLTYGSYRMESGRPARCNGRYTTDDFRQSKFTGSHLKTFKHKLFRGINFKSLRNSEGEFFMTCADLALMLPMLEMAGLDRIRHIKHCLYCYNDLNPLNDHKVHKQDQVNMTKFIRGMDRYHKMEY